MHQNVSSNDDIPEDGIEFDTMDSDTVDHDATSVLDSTLIQVSNENHHHNKLNWLAKSC